MPFESKVYRILIATPSDVDEEREIIARVIQSWNDLNSYTKRIVLLPLRWETHLAPEYGERPQEIINKAIVDDCDLLIGCFWTRIGSPTGKEESGTLEEIKRVSDSGKPIMLYFSKRGQDPSLIDLEQLRKLNDFKKDIKQKALIEEYSSSIDFRDKLTRQLEIKIREVQKNTKDIKVITEMSFISIETGFLLSHEIKMTAELPIVNKKEIEKVLSQNNKYKEKREDITKEISRQILRHSTLPIVFGIKNLSNFSLENIIVEIKVPRNDNVYTIFGEHKRYRSNFSYSAYRNDVSPEILQKLNVLDTDGVLKLEDDAYSFSFPESFIQRDRLKIIRPYLFIRPSESCKIIFEVKLFADSLLEPQMQSCSIEIETVEVKKSVSDFIPDIDEFIDQSEIPF
jgi:hypothetical protein